MKNVINFSELGRKEIRCLIYTDEKGEIQKENNQEAITRLKEESEAPIEIYNPNGEQKKKIIEILRKYVDKKTGTTNIDGIIIIKEFLEMLTNIKLDLNNDEMIQKIVEDPSEILLYVQGELGKIFTEVKNRFIENVSILNNLNEEELKQLLNKYKDGNNKENELTEEELKIVEKAKKLGKI